MGRAAGGRGGGAHGLRFFGKSFFKVPMDPHAYNTLKQVAVARGLNNVDELLVTLGKRGDEISSSDALDLLREELGVDGFVDYVWSRYYRDPKGPQCQRLLNKYLEV